MAGPTKTLGWEAFASVADEFFGSLKRSELAWARQAWEVLGRAGLTAAGGELDRHLVAVRFVALARVYAEFCRHAWGKGAPPRLSDLAYYLELDALRLGQLLGPAEPLPGASGDDLVEAGLALLVERERPALHRALIEAAGSASRLFAAMWRTAEPADLPEDRRESDESILNDLSFEKIDAFEYVSRGFVARVTPPELGTPVRPAAAAGPERAPAAKRARLNPDAVLAALEQLR